ncbi:fibronectin type III domain-containing protein [Paenibacillus sp. HWE-109]|uniref:fibronectin type III domain-containing protein n=1 Tax=Paenibacillus sp. HWE-109 TaxID=1306526 RepID=UPI001EDE80B6|nr:fibronectin type III domain-containing protein [Paenibacillus sp. HWE-109]UKS24193.1 fibronectin type III domain-containing protein [Paenibacillus sp. HWE-109]
MSKLKQRLMFLFFTSALLLSGLLFDSSTSFAISPSLSLSGGGTSSKAIDANGTIYGWGANSTYQIGDGTNVDRKIPVAALSIPNVASVSTGAGHTLILTTNGKVYAYGANDLGQLGLGTTGSPQTTPQELTTLSGIFIVEVSTYMNHNLALDNQGKVYSWGDNSTSQLGRTGSTSIPTEVVFPTYTGFGNRIAKSINATRGNSYAVMTDGTVAGWGDNFYKQVVNLSGVYIISAPEKIAGLSNITKVKGAWQGAMALNGSGNVLSWGTNNSYLLGQPSQNTAYSPTLIANLSGVKDIVMGNTQSVALGTDKKVRAWGDNTRTGTSATSSFYTPALVSGIPGNVIAIGGGNFHVITLTDTGKLYTFGSNGNGQLGNNTTTSSQLPILINQTISLNLGPTPPASITQSNVTTNSATLTWSPSAAGYYSVTGYNIYQNGALIGTTAGTTYSLAGLSAGSTYSYTIKAKDSANNLSLDSNTISITTLFSQLTATPGVNVVQLAWNPIPNALEYQVKRAAASTGPYTTISSSTSTSFTDSSVTGGVTYYYKITGIDAVGDIGNSNIVSVVPIAPDITPPTAPSGLISNAHSGTTVELNWTASTDNVAVAAYDIYVNSSLAGTVSGNVYTVSGLALSTTYTFTVYARDAEGNVSSPSNSIQVTTYNSTNHSVVIGGNTGLFTSEDGLASWADITPDSLNYMELYTAGSNMLALGTRTALNDRLIGYGYLSDSFGFGTTPIVTLDGNHNAQQMPVYAAVYGNGKYVVAGGYRIGNNTSTIGYTSTDGTNFTQTIDGYRNANANYNSGDAMGIIKDGVYGNGKFVLIGNTDYLSYTATSLNGSNWSIQLTATALNYNGITYGNGKFVTVGMYPTGTGTFRPVIDSSTNGTNWSSSPLILNSYYNKQLNGVAYGNGKFIAVGTGGLILYSTDAITWSAASPATSSNLNAVAYDESTGKFIAVGNDGTILSSSTGATWTAFASVGGDYQSVAVFPGSLLP